MIHIFKTPSGYTVSTIASSDKHELLSSSGRQLFSRKEKCWVNIQAQMKEWRSDHFVLVQDNTLKIAKVFKVYADRVVETPYPPESTKESRNSKKKKSVKKVA